MRRLIAILMLASLAACATLQHQESYRQAAPARYPPTTNVLLFEYRNVNIRDIYELLYSDFLIIGRSEFNGAYEDPRASVGFAKSIGADVFVTTSQFRGRQTSFVPAIAPTNSTSYVSGFSGNAPFYGTSYSYGTTTTMIPVQYNRYEQSGLYLKNVNHVVPLWERKSADYKETAANALSGIWYNEDFDLKIYQSGAQMVAFFDTAPRNGGKIRESGTVDELKMIFNPQTGAGVYLMADRAPQPAEIKVNKFGFLQVDIASQGELVSFARRK
ncbi:hypothetical protein MIZ01_1075 [Sideroxyarcus emersonii]|uniref:Uncharacterized protein n=1 Tax=Sideroxyarcus emersonii TaxID=2764705 RepID=A0AAN1XA32_9PROT|nr:hypothetical protein [Sideroxyarcus emersonii]BCK87303.1 hypothetical protein MIZ01_1075 [Sideroxyarcus emersonii]